MWKSRNADELLRHRVDDATARLEERGSRFLKGEFDSGSIGGEGGIRAIMDEVFLAVFRTT